MPDPKPRSTLRHNAEPEFQDRRVPSSARGLGVALRRLLGALKRPLRLQWRGLQLHVVLVDRRSNPSPLAAPSEAQLLAELGVRLLAIDHEHAATGMRQLVLVHDKLRREGWSGVETLTTRDLGRALAQCELLASLEHSPAMSMLAERLRILKTAAEVRDERRPALRAEGPEELRGPQGPEGQVEVTETSFDAFHDTHRSGLGMATSDVDGGEGPVR
jgi:hypothetical protein